jgi:CRP-like cAMP-binding protein
MAVLSKDLTFAEHQPLFAGLSKDILGEIWSNSLVQEHAASRLLVQQGEEAKGLYLVITGAVKIFRVDESGGESIIRMLKPGETCMAAALFTGEASPVSVQTLTKCRLLMIPAAVVRSHTQVDARFAANMLRIVAQHYKDAVHQIDALHTKSPLQRVGHYFLSQHIEKGREDLEFSLPFKKQAIANYLGMTPETFSRTLGKMKAIGIDVDDSTIRMQDVYALCRFCDSDTSALCPQYADECSGCPLH